MCLFFCKCSGCTLITECFSVTAFALTTEKKSINNSRENQTLQGLLKLHALALFCCFVLAEQMQLLDNQSPDSLWVRIFLKIINRNFFIGNQTVRQLFHRVFMITVMFFLRDRYNKGTILDLIAFGFDTHPNRILKYIRIIDNCLNITC